VKAQQRAEKILLSLKTLGIVSTSQLRIINNLGSTRTTFRALEEVKEYVNKFREGENMYYLNAEGRKLIGSKKVMKKTTTAMHYIMRNDLYIALECPGNWRNEQKLSSKKHDITVIADAYFEINNVKHIVEVDHKQKMAANKLKIEKYKKMVELGVLSSDTQFFWITVTEYRRQQLIDLMQGLNANVFTISDFH
jgi:hypothetical protein